MNCPHGRKAIACEGCHPDGPPPELLKAIELIAEAKTISLLAARGTTAGTSERTWMLSRLRTLNDAVRSHLGTMGGLQALPHGLMVEVRVCEMVLERLTP